MINGKSIYTSNMYDKDPHLSDFINNSIALIANEIGKISVKSIVEGDDKIKVQNDDITRLFRDKPNPLQTTSDFLSSVEWLRRKYCNAFIYSQYVWVRSTKGNISKMFTGFYPLNPQSIQIGLDENSEVWEIEFNFSDGNTYRLPYSELIHLKWRRGVNLVLGGGDDLGNPNHYEVIRTLDALDKTIQGLPKAIEASSQIKGVYTSKSTVGNDLMNKELAEFEKRIVDSKRGIIAVNLTGDFTPVNITPPRLESSTMDFLKGIIQEKYGVSTAMLSGDYTSTQNAAFYQTCIEDFIVQFEQVFTACCFTPRERDVGHIVKCYYDKIGMLTEEQRMERARYATDTGIMTLNEIKSSIFGEEPFDGGDIRLRSLNYVDTNIANQYQIGKVGSHVGQDKV